MGSKCMLFTMWLLLFFSEVLNASIIFQGEQRTLPLSPCLLVLHKTQGKQYFDTLNIYCLSQDKMKFPQPTKIHQDDHKGDRVQNSSVQYMQQITSLTTLEERWLINLTATKKHDYKIFTGKKTVQKIKTGQPFVYEMLLTLFWLLKIPFHYPHQSTQGV